MIGRVVFSERGVVATLEDDGRWSCPDDPELERFLAVAFRHEPRPSDGMPGWALLDRVAAKLGAASVEKELKPSAEEREPRRCISATHRFRS